MKKAIPCKGVYVQVSDNFDPLYPEEGHDWTVLIRQSKTSNLDVVVAWYPTRREARAHAKRLRKSLRVTARRSHSQERCPSVCPGK